MAVSIKHNDFISIVLFLTVGLAVYTGKQEFTKNIDINLDGVFFLDGYLLIIQDLLVTKTIQG